jgi:dihydrofolate synthase/folylpolyglutamate synthase
MWPRWVACAGLRRKPGCHHRGGGLGGEVVCHATPLEAMQAAKGQASESDRILAFGSFYTVAGALEALRKKP